MANEQRGGAPTGPCATPDSIAIRGSSRLPDADVRSDLGITPKSTISGQVVTQALKTLYATNNFEANGTATCEIIGGKSVLAFNVTERRILGEVSAAGPNKVSRSALARPDFSGRGVSTLRGAKPTRFRPRRRSG